MIKTDKFSGESYFESESFKIGNHNNSFSKMGNGAWIGNKGEIVQKVGQHWINTTTGTSSASGDPFKSEDQ